MTLCTNLDAALDAAESVGYPVELKASFSMGPWSQVCHDRFELERHFPEALKNSPTAECGVFSPEPSS